MVLLFPLLQRLQLEQQMDSGDNYGCISSLLPRKLTFRLSE
jgi:hypothetical protein